MAVVVAFPFAACQLHQDWFAAFVAAVVVAAEPVVAAVAAESADPLDKAEQACEGTSFEVAAADWG